MRGKAILEAGIRLSGGNGSDVLWGGAGRLKGVFFTVGMDRFLSGPCIYFHI